MLSSRVAAPAAPQEARRTDRVDSWEVIPTPSPTNQTTKAASTSQEHREIVIFPPKLLALQQQQQQSSYSSSPTLSGASTPSRSSCALEARQLVTDDALMLQEEIHLKELTALRGHISRLTSQLASSKSRIDTLELLMMQAGKSATTTSKRIDGDDYYDGPSDLVLLARTALKTTLGIVVFSMLRRRLNSPSELMAGLMVLYGVMAA